MLYEHKLEYERQKASLIKGAREALKNGLSYRNFNVGCAVLACSGQKQEYKVFVGANLKAGPGTVKVCAERVAIMASVSAGYNFIVAIVVCGEPQKDEVSGVNSPTLHPCDVCRETLYHLIVHDERFETVVEFDTILLTVNKNTGEREEMTLRELFDIHSCDYLFTPEETPQTLRQILLERGHW
jgi:cytidine deaminase